MLNSPLVRFQGSRMHDRELGVKKELYGKKVLSSKRNFPGHLPFPKCGCLVFSVDEGRVRGQVPGEAAGNQKAVRRTLCKRGAVVLFRAGSGPEAWLWPGAGITALRRWV